MELSARNLHAISKIFHITLDQSQWSSVHDELDRQIGSAGRNVFYH